MSLAKKAEEYVALPAEEFTIAWDVYQQEVLDEYQEDGELSAEEAAFMHGYLAS